MPAQPRPDTILKAQRRLQEVLESNAGMYGDVHLQDLGPSSTD